MTRQSLLEAALDALGSPECCRDSPGPRGSWRLRRGLESGLSDGCPACSRKARQPQPLELSPNRRFSLRGADRRGIVDETQPAKRVQPPQLRTAGEPVVTRVSWISRHRDPGYILVIALTRVRARKARTVCVA